MECCAGSRHIDRGCSVLDAVAFFAIPPQIENSEELSFYSLAQRDFIFRVNWNQF